MAPVPPKLAVIFGVPEDAQDMFSSLDFSHVIIDASEQREDTFTCKLAPSFRTLDQPAIMQMDDHIKIMITATTRAIEGIKAEDRSWETVYSTLLQNPLLEPLGDEIVKVDRLERDGYTWFKFSDAPEKLVLDAVEDWFAKLLEDEDVRKATPIDIKGIAKVVAATGARIEHLLSLETIAQDITREKTVVDIGVLRYPDITHPYFKVYKIRLDAWGYSRNALGIQSNKHGVSGHYNCCKFKPRDEIIKDIKERVKTAAVQEAENLLAY